MRAPVLPFFVIDVSCLLIFFDYLMVDVVVGFPGAFVTAFPLHQVLASGYAAFV